MVTLNMVNQMELLQLSVVVVNLIQLPLVNHQVSLLKVCQRTRDVLQIFFVHKAPKRIREDDHTEYGQPDGTASVISGSSELDTTAISEPPAEPVESVPECIDISDFLDTSSRLGKSISNQTRQLLIK